MSIATSYKIILSPAEGSYSELGSTFLAYAYSIKDEEMIKTIKNKLKKEHHKAVHVAFGCRIGFDGEIERSTDDGEPSGTAGRPILNVLKNNALVFTGIFVVRYYGGKKLGVPGLINAYRSAAVDCTNKSKITVVQIYEQYKITFPESDQHSVLHALNKAGAQIIDTHYEKTCTFIIQVPRHLNEKILATLSSLWQIELHHIQSL